MSESLSLSAPQAIFLRGLKTPFRAFVGGMGSGKTLVGAVDHWLFALEHPGVVQGFFAPTYQHIRDTFWPTIEEAAEKLDMGLSVKIHRADKVVHLYRGGVHYGSIICRSMDDPGAIVGFKIARAIVDEIDTLPTDKARAAWQKIIARMRYVIPGVVNGIGVTTTPEGFKFVYQMFKRNPGVDYSMVQASTLENAKNLPPSYIESLRNTYPQELIDAYIEGEFVNLTSGTVYRNYNRTLCRSAETIQPGEPLHIGQDFNVGGMASVINVERHTGQPGWHVVGELVGILDTPALIQTIKSKFLGHAVYVYPDASGKARKTVGASVSDIGLLEQAGFRVRAKDANPPVKDRVLAMNTAYEKARLWVNDRAAPRFAESQEQQAYDKNGEPDKSAGFDHLNDAQGYFAHWTMPVRKPVFLTGIGMGRTA
jgi:hypothetical protein